MAKKDLPPIETLREILDLDPAAGKLHWKHRSPSFFKTEANANAWNARYAGKEAFTSKDGNGYHNGCIFSVSTHAHIVVWAIHYGEYPASVVDHADGDPSNNKINNLRLATRQENNRNRRPSRGSSSRYLGVMWRPAKGFWEAAIRFDGKQHFLGYFRDEWEAAQAYNRAASEKFGEFARLNNETAPVSYTHLTLPTTPYV